VEALARVAGVVEQQRVEEADSETGPVVMTPIMRRCEERKGPVKGFSQSMLLQVPAELGEDALLGALQALLDHHDVLRMRLVIGEGDRRWSLEIPGPRAILARECIRRIDIVGLT